MAKPATVWLDGPCALLTCWEEGPHSHPVCPECGAVRYGNGFCATCRAQWPAMAEETKAAFDAAERRRDAVGPDCSDCGRPEIEHYCAPDLDGSCCPAPRREPA